jgi:uncharacterized protein (TIRG00374 family)
MKRQLLIGTLVSAVFLYFALRGIDWAAFGDAFAQTNIWYVLVGAFFTLFGHYIRAYRWRFMLLPVRPVSTWSAFSATCVGLAFNNLLPARLGEVVRAVSIGRSDSISKSAAFATIVYERVVDVFGLLVLLWFVLLRASGPEWLTRSGVILLVLNVLLLALLYYMHRYQDSFMRLLQVFMRPLPRRFADRVAGWMLAFIDGLHVVRSARIIVPMVITSIGVWAAAGIGIWFCMVAMSIHVPPIASVVLLVLIPLGTMVPSAPAYLGPVQYACILGLGIYGVGKSEALAYSMVFHAHHFFPVTLAGLYFAWRSHITVSDATEPKAEAQPG